MRLIGAIDLFKGKCVRLVRGELATAKTYYENPLDALSALQAAGADAVHVVDLEAAVYGESRNGETILSILRSASLPVQVGGGIRSISAARDLLENGAWRVVVSSILAEDEGLARQMCAELGGERIAAAIDEKNGQALTHGWKEKGGDALELAKRAEALGISEIIYTNIPRDGSLEGLDEPRVRAFIASCPLPVIVSGGVSSVADAVKAQGAGAAGLIVGKAFYEEKFSFMEAKACLRKE
jgi:phosphoribosylformimino-5-aminoimidazole carboxamide ribotide isomerase